MDVRMTTTVVAYTSLRLGQVTRAVSLRTSERNRRERPHQPVTLSRARSPMESFSSCSAIALAFCISKLPPPSAPISGEGCPAGALAKAGRLCQSPTYYRPNWQDRRESNPQPPVLETGALPIELLSFI